MYRWRRLGQKRWDSAHRTDVRLASERWRKTWHTLARSLQGNIQRPPCPCTAIGRCHRPSPEPRHSVLADRYSAGRGSWTQAPGQACWPRPGSTKTGPSMCLEPRQDAGTTAAPPQRAQTQSPLSRASPSLQVTNYLADQCGSSSTIATVRSIPEQINGLIPRRHADSLVRTNMLPASAFFGLFRPKRPASLNRAMPPVAAVPERW